MHQCLNRVVCKWSSIIAAVKIILSNVYIYILTLEENGNFLFAATDQITVYNMTGNLL